MSHTVRETLMKTRYSNQTIHTKVPSGQMTAADPESNHAGVANKKEWRPVVRMGNWLIPAAAYDL
jgi:hypothetical protein